MGQMKAFLFSNLFYDTDVPIDGAEYIVNPETLGDRINKLESQVPEVVVQDLRDVHEKLQHGEVIHKSQVQRGDMLSFTNLAIYHKTPDPKEPWCRFHSSENFFAEMDARRRQEKLGTGLSALRKSASASILSDWLKS